MVKIFHCLMVFFTRAGILAVCPMFESRSMASTLRADQQGCQKGLVEDHSGGYRIETLWPERTTPTRLHQVVKVDAAHPTARRVVHARPITELTGWPRPTGIL